MATTRLAPATLAWAEVATLQLLLLLVLLAEGRTWLVTLGRSIPRLAGLPLAGLLGTVLALGVAQAPAPQQNAPASGSGHQLTLSGGYLGNGYDERPSTGCGHSASIYHHANQVGGAEVNYQWQPDTAKGLFNAVGGGVWAGSEDISVVASAANRLATGYIARHTLFDTHLYLERRRSFPQRNRLLNYRLGIHAGELGQSIYGYDATSHGASNFYPELMVAAGSPRLFGQLDLGYGAENALGNYTGRFGLGTGFGQFNGSTLLAGVAVSSHYENPAMAFASARLRLPVGGRSQLVLEPYAATGFNEHYLFSLKLHYQLGLR